MLLLPYIAACWTLDSDSAWILSQVSESAAAGEAAILGGHTLVSRFSAQLRTMCSRSNRVSVQVRFRVRHGRLSSNCPSGPW